MGDGVDFGIDLDAFGRAGEQLVRDYLSAGTASIGRVTERLERKLEAATQSAVPGRLWRAWQSSRFPVAGPARNPVGTVWLKGGARTRGAIAFWTQPGAIRGKSGQFLAVPLPAAGSRGRDRFLTPGDWERAHPGVRLIFIYRPGKPSLLVAKGGTINARSGTFRPITRARTAADARRGFTRGEQTVPIFVLLPLVNFRNAFAIEPAVTAAEGELAEEFFAAVRAVGRS